MNKWILSLVTSLSALAVNSQNELVFEGTYQGTNLYVQNPFSSSGVGFCVADVKINNKQSIDEINSSAFEIDFSSYQIKKGESVVVKIEYKDGCAPRVLNPEVLRSASTFEVKSIKVENNGVLTWTTSDESGSLPFIIEQFRWNKWIKVGEVKGKGTAGDHTYTFQTKPHSGANKFRVKQVDYTKKPRESKEARLLKSPVEEVFIANENLLKIDDKVRFKDASGAPAETMFEITDQFGSLVRKGFGKEVDIKSLNKGVYYVSYDNKIEMIEKK
jgi:hypothetical protein